MPESIPPQDFAAVWHEEGGSPAAVARRLGVMERAVYSRRARLVERGYDLATGSGHIDNDAPRHAYAPRVLLYVEDGSVVVWSDRH